MAINYSDTKFQNYRIPYLRGGICFKLQALREFCQLMKKDNVHHRD